MLIQLNPTSRKFKQLVITESDSKKDAFIEEFARAVAEIQKDDPVEDHLIRNPNWVKVKRYGADS